VPPGDVLVVATNSPSTDGLFGELFATALPAARRPRRRAGGGVRDVADLREMRFPVWSRAVSAQGTVKATAGAVNVPVVLGGQTVRPGDVVVADDDGVTGGAARRRRRALTASQARVDKEAATAPPSARASWASTATACAARCATRIEYVAYEEYAKEPG
jgi:4-hydroxy-4-methyl-2-oxoglutarate aldolase